MTKLGPLALRFVLALSTLIFLGCGRGPVDQVELMPAPDVFGDGLLDILPEERPFDKLPYDGILFATDRAPATEADREQYYRNDRGQIVRVGLAEITFGQRDFTWEFAREVSLLRSRSEQFPVKISNVEEWGILGETKPFWFDKSALGEVYQAPDATARFANAINQQLAVSDQKDVYIYVHGFKVVYENPVLVSAELWHFLGYEGVFIAYAWPSTPSAFAYVSDSDTSAGYARNFRIMLELIAQQTDVEAIHIIGYSNGTRLVTRAMEQLALIHQGKTREEIAEIVKLKNVILVGSDLDRGVFGSYMADGMLDVAEHVSVYMSRYDRALGVSQILSRRERLGQMWGGRGGEIHPAARQAIDDLQGKLTFINVSDAEGATSGNGHGYFQSSPWASSDVLMTMYYGLTPEQRGLVEDGNLPVYNFPPDYIARLWAAIKEVDPEFAEEYEAFRAAQAANSR